MQPNAASEMATIPPAYASFYVLLLLCSSSVCAHLVALSDGNRKDCKDAYYKQLSEDFFFW